jgi:hypothetical protein
LRDLIPKGSIVESYPFYDGNVEFALSQNDRFLVGTTDSPVVFEFWKYAIEDPKHISQIADHLQPIIEENTFDIIRKNWFNYKDPYVRSAMFFLLNRFSELGMITHGEMNPKNYNPIAINILRTFEITNFHINFLKEKTIFDQTIKNDVSLFMPGVYYYDLLHTAPPIGIEESHFKHTKTLKHFAKKKSIFVYNFHPRLANNKDYEKIFLDKHGRISQKDNAKEIILHNV